MPNHEAEVSEGYNPASQPVFDSAMFRKNLILSGTLALVFLATYFAAAIITSAPFKEVAATMLLGLPLAAWVGWIAIGMGIVVTRIYLVRTK